MDKAIAIHVMLRGGSNDNIMIPLDFIAPLAQSIRTKGSEYLTLTSKVIEVVGFMVIGKKTGERVIVIGESESGE